MRQNTLTAECWEHVEKLVPEERAVQTLGIVFSEALSKPLTGLYKDWNHDHNRHNTEPEMAVEWRQEISPVHINHTGLSDENSVAGKIHYALVLSIFKLTPIYTIYYKNTFTSS